MPIGQPNDDLKQFFQNMADRSDCELKVFERDVSRIHFLIRYIPHLSIFQSVSQINAVIHPPTMDQTSFPDT
jgi:REP element-mobilizing transposase RayT